MSIDGGLTALGGFLYQTVVALSLKADTFQEYHDAPINKDDLETVLGFAKEGELRYEDEDQDLSIRNILHADLPGYILVQFKYSSIDPPPPITLHALEKILLRLQASAERVRITGQQVTGYSLLTNRPLHKDAERMANDDPLFYVSSAISERYGEERLRQFARYFGCIDAEIDAGIRKGIGDLLLRATHPRRYGEPIITREMIIQLFTGHPEAHKITPEIVAKKSQQQLNKLFTKSFHLDVKSLDVKSLLVRERVHKQISNLVERHAFIVLSGVGGNGKTAALWQWMSDSFLSELPQQRGVYYSLSPSQWVQENFLAHQFCNWVHVPDTHHWHFQEPDQILDRLDIARTASMKIPVKSHSIVVLGLDAIDEVLEHEPSALRNLLMWFWEQEIHLPRRPRATLIVTCRNAEEVAERLSLTSPYEEKLKPFREVEVLVDQFSPSELVAAARLSLPALAERFEQAYRSLELPSAFLASNQTYRPLEVQQLTFFGSSLEATSVLQPENPALQSVDGEVFQALLHPTLWHCLLEIKDGMMQSRVLDGEVNALEQLASHFLRWFCWKMIARGKRRIRYEEVKEVLKAIAHHCDPHRSPKYQNKDWVTCASRTPYMNREQAESFFEEALSAGLIVGDRRGWWRWRHPFIGEYLALQPLDEGEE